MHACWLIIMVSELLLLLLLLLDAKLVVDVDQASNVIAIIVADCKDGIKRIPLVKI